MKLCLLHPHFRFGFIFLDKIFQFIFSAYVQRYNYEKWKETENIISLTNEFSPIFKRHSRNLFYFLQAMKQSQKKLQKNHKMEKTVSITWDLLLLFQKIKQLNLYILPEDFSTQEYILPAVFIILWKPNSETKKKMNVFEFSNTMFVTQLFDWAKRQGVFREKNMAYFFLNRQLVQVLTV